MVVLCSRPEVECIAHIFFDCVVVTTDVGVLKFLDLECFRTLNM